MTVNSMIQGLCQNEYIKIIQDKHDKPANLISKNLPEKILR